METRIVIRRLLVVSVFCCSLPLLKSDSAYALDHDEPDYELKLLGKYVFFDKISVPAGRMGCVSCHTPDTGGTFDDANVNLHQVAITGANPHTVGSLKPPTNAYASFIEPFADCGKGGVFPGGHGYCGGNFWNGRAEGVSPALLPGSTKHIDDEVFQDAALDDPIRDYAAYFGPTADQALNPFVNPVEQNDTRAGVCQHVAHAPYAELYEIAWGAPIDCSNTPVTIQASDVVTETELDISFKRIALAVGAWQHSRELNSFSSKRDRALRQELACFDGGGGPFASYYNGWICAAKTPDTWGKFPLLGFTDEENRGHDLFYNTAPPFGPHPPPPPHPELPVTNCSFCHLSDTEHPDGTGVFERYADDQFHNIGVPVNPELPADPDPGISGQAGLDPPTAAGGFKIPTLRNVDKRPHPHFLKAYGHNGWFKSLASIVHFYNTSRTLPRCETVIAYSGPYTEKEALQHNCWPEAEWPDTVATPLLVGAIGMTPAQEAALVAYLKTLTDRETPQPPPPYHSHDHGPHCDHDP